MARALTNGVPSAYAKEDHAIRAYPCRAASEVVTECGREMPGHGSAQSKVKMLQNRHRDHLAATS